jgi:phenylpropionate dioxygenase-like ring-hydroxylating dioxygenase large terminal subunit
MTVTFDSDRYTTLPRECYLEDRGRFEAEMRNIWYRRWLYLGHVSQIPERGDFVSRELLGERVLLIRGDDGEVRALLNVCRHRGARMIDASCGRAKRLVCPYHQWTYDLSGRLTAAPSMSASEIGDSDRLGLYRLPVEIWGGFVFGCLGEDSPEPITPEIERLAPTLDRYAPERLRLVASRTYACAANWKLMLENYMECYHCSASHPEFIKTADLRARATAAYAEQALEPHRYWSTDVPLRDGMISASSDGVAVCRVPLGGGEGFTSGQSRSFGDWAAASVMYFYADYAMVHRIVPVDSRETRFELSWFVSADAGDEDYDVDAITHVWDMTTRQDIALIERTQDGLRSRRYTPGPLSVKHEPYVHASLQLYQRAMSEEFRDRSDAAR